MSRQKRAGWQRKARSRTGFDPPHTTIHVGTVQGGTILNIIPERCEFVMEWRTIPGDDATRHVERMRQFVADSIEPAMHAVNADTGFDFEVLTLMPGLSLAADHELTAHRQAAHRFEQHGQGELRHRGRLLPGRRHPDDRLWSRPHRAGAPAGRVDRAGAARCMRCVHPPSGGSRARLTRRSHVTDHAAAVASIRSAYCRPRHRPLARRATPAFGGFTTRDSGVAGPHVALLAITHGNEIAGAIVLDRLLEAQLTPTRGQAHLRLRQPCCIRTVRSTSADRIALHR